MKKIAFVALATILIYMSCSKSSDSASSVTPSLGIKFEELKIANSPYQLNVYIPTDSIIVGNNPLNIVLTDTLSGRAITNASIQLLPIMTASNGMHQHSGPTVQPIYSDSTGAYVGSFAPVHGSASSYDPATGFYTGWRMRYVVTVSGNKYDTVIADFATKSVKTGTKFLTSVAGNDGNTYYIVLESPSQSKQTVGIQPIQIAMYKSINSAMNFEPVTDASIGNFYPYMPDMGHSSPNNVIPSGVGNGRYRGVVNLTMGGAWDLRFIGIKKNGVSIIDSTALQIAF